LGLVFNLSCEDAGTSGFLDLLLCASREQPSFDDDWLLGQDSLTQDLEVTGAVTVDDWNLLALGSGCLLFVVF